MSVDALLQIRRREHEALLQQSLKVLQADQRIMAAWLFGSVGRHTSDVFGDLDLWVIVRDESIETMSAQRQSYAAQLDRPILLLESPGNAPAGVRTSWPCIQDKRGCIRWIGTGSDTQMRVSPVMRCCCLTGEASPRIRDKNSSIQQEHLLPSPSKSKRSRPPNSALLLGDEQHSGQECPASPGMDRRKPSGRITRVSG